MEMKLDKLVLDNFRAHKHLELDFCGRNASIYGDNATGKSTIKDSVHWLFFGTDAQGNGEKSINIKPLNEQGEVADHQAITSVEAVLTVDGEQVTLKRTLQEVWTTKRGNPEPVYTGNQSEYYVNGVPVKANAFKSTIEDMVSPELFKMLSDTHYFAGDLHWQKRREKLFEMAGTMTDAEIMETSAEFAPLAQAMGKLTIDQFRTKLTSERKQYNGARNEIPARIDECKKNIETLEGLDFAGAREKLDILNARADALQAELAKLDNNTAVADKRMELRAVQMQMDGLEMENKAHRASQAPASPTERNNLISQISRAENRVAGVESHRAMCVRQIEDLDKQIEGGRQMWKEVNKRKFTPKDCPTCGQALPADQVQAAKERFEAEKKAKLAEIVATAERYKGMRKSMSEEFERAVQNEQAERASIEQMRAELAKLDANVVVVEDMPDYAERKAGLANLLVKTNADLQVLSENANTAASDIRQKLSDIKREISAQNEVIGKEGVLKYTQERIEQLRADAANTAEKLAEVERHLFLCEEYGRYKAKFVEQSVNNLFRLCEWRLFRQQANGGIEDRCDATVNGVPYLDLNSGCKLNVGIDVCNALSKAYGVRVPLIVDNAESCTALEATESQVIRLVVSESDKTLRVVYH